MTIVSSVRGAAFGVEVEEDILDEGGSVSPVPMMAIVEPSLMPYADTGDVRQREKESVVRRRRRNQGDGLIEQKETKRTTEHGHAKGRMRGIKGCEGEADRKAKR